VLEATGRPLADWHGTGVAPLLDEPSATLFLNPDRAELYRRIDARFDAMLAAGALDEVRALDACGLDPLLPAMKAHGVPWLRRHLRGEIALDEAADGGKRDTRHYAKRQSTWFRHQLPDWTWVAPEEGEAAVLAQLDVARA
jgi:tRNA dimethylallyltransferase